MKKREVPLFLFNGMLESGKTTMIGRMLQNPQLADGRRILLIVCEEGLEEFDEVEMKKKNVTVVPLEEETDFCKTTFENFDRRYRPDYVITEFNGMWNPEDMVTVGYPNDWVIAQIMTLVNSETFMNYYNNMRMMVANQLKMTDMVVFNRFEDEKNDKFAFRSACKGQNLRAQVVYEYKNGIIDTQFDASPFDLDQNEIEISDADFPTWYFDVMDNAMKYDKKTIKVFCQAAKLSEPGSTGFVIGRNVMTCCANDIQFMGVYCVNDMEFEDEAFYHLCATVQAVDGSVYGEDPGEVLPVLQVISLEPAQKPQEEVLML